MLRQLRPHLAFPMNDVELAMQCGKHWPCAGSRGRIGSIGSLAEVYRMQPQQESLEYRYATALHWSLTQFTPATVSRLKINSHSSCCSFGRVLGNQ